MTILTSSLNKHGNAVRSCLECPHCPPPTFAPPASVASQSFEVGFDDVDEFFSTFLDGNVPKHYAM